MDALITTVTTAREARQREIEREEVEFFRRMEGDKGLKRHQLDGVQWMSAMYDCGLSFILGDEMGMGKTAQAITFIGRLVEKGYTTGQPVLVVVPLAVLTNWEVEFQHWLPPSVRVIIHHPSAHNGGRESLIERWKEDEEEEEASALVVLTTPSILVTDFEVINAHGGRWSLVVVDEAHTAKNSASAFSKHLEALETESLLLMTGTIVHNNVEEELLHLLSLVVPPAAKQALLALPAHQRGHHGLFVGSKPTAELERISRVLYCFMMRRLMRGVNMPPKSSCMVHLAQTPLQVGLYGADRGKVYTKEMIDKHPFLGILTAKSGLGFLPYAPAAQHSDYTPHDRAILSAARLHSSKIQFISHILPALLRRSNPKHRVLIFSNSLGVLHLLGLYLSVMEGYCVDMIVGDVRDIEERKQRLDRFNGGGIGAPEIMLLSTKAMGQGVQLVGADTVIFFDHHDNPQNDNQAEARAYRLTQTKPVLVLRLVTHGTKEEEAMESWVKRKREVQQWLEFTRVVASSAGSPPAVQAPTEILELSDEATLNRLLLDMRKKEGQYSGVWRG